MSEVVVFFILSKQSDLHLHVMARLRCDAGGSGGSILGNLEVSGFLVRSRQVETST